MNYTSLISKIASGEHAFWLAITVGLIITTFAFLYNLRLAKKSREWDRKKHISITAERFCDEMKTLTVSYWSKESSEKTIKEIQVLHAEISAHCVLMSRYLTHSFPRNKKIITACRKAIDSITGGEFAKKNRPANTDRLAHSVSTLVNLRLEISRNLIV